jgi:hypothetical protein
MSHLTVEVPSVIEEARHQYFPCSITPVVTALSQYTHLQSLDPFDIALAPDSDSSVK